MLLLDVGSVLWKRVRRGEIAAAQAIAGYNRIASLDIEWAAAPSLTRAALHLALELAHPIYDCVYMALAAEIDVPLATADIRLVRAGSRLKPPLRVLALAEAAAMARDPQ